MAVRHYNLDQVTFTIAGVPVTEYAEGDAITIEYTDDDWMTTKGHHGSVIRGKKPNTVADVTVTTMQGSPVNELLQNLADADLQSGLAAGPMFVKDLNGTSLASASRAWVKKRPGLKFATEPGSVEWALTAGDMNSHQGQSRLL